MPMPRMHLPAIGLTAAMAALLAGCGGGSGPSQGGLVPLTSPGQEATANSVPLLVGDATFQAAFDAQLQQFRSQSYGGSVPVTLENSTILRTASIRHAGYMHTVNVEYDGTNLTAVDTLRVTEASTLSDLSVEAYSQGLPELSAPNFNTNVPDTAVPILFTAIEQLKRIQAISGGPALLSSLGNYELYEGYSFHDNTLDFVTANLPGDLSQFRGHPTYSVAENMWYNPLYRLPMMRANTRYYGIGTVAEAQTASGFDDSQVAIPGALLGTPNRLDFEAVGTFVGWNPQVNVESFWPSDNLTGVKRYGFDYVQGGGTDANQRYSGPPIHIIVGSTANWPDDQGTGWQEISMWRVDGYGDQDYDGAGGDPVTTDENVNTAGGASLRVYGLNAYTGAIATNPTAGDPAFTPVANPSTLYFGTAGAGAGNTTTITRTLFIGANVQVIDPEALTSNPGWPTFGAAGDTYIKFYDNVTAALNLLAAGVGAGTINNVTLTILPYEDPFIAFDANNLTDGANAGTYTVNTASINAGDRSLLVDAVLTQEEWAGTGPAGQTVAGWPAAGDPRVDPVDGNSTQATATITYDETVTFGTEVPSLRAGEILMVPEDPLVPGAWYTVRVQLATADDAALNQTTLTKQFWFQVAP